MASIRRVVASANCCLLRLDIALHKSSEMLKKKKKKSLLVTKRGEEEANCFLTVLKGFRYTARIPPAEEGMKTTTTTKGGGYIPRHDALQADNTLTPAHSRHLMTLLIKKSADRRLFSSFLKGKTSPGCSGPIIHRTSKGRVERVYHIFILPFYIILIFFPPLCQIGERKLSVNAKTFLCRNNELKLSQSFAKRKEKGRLRDSSV